MSIDAPDDLPVAPTVPMSAQVVCVAGTHDWSSDDTLSSAGMAWGGSSSRGRT